MFYQAFLKRNALKDGLTNREARKGGYELKAYHFSNYFLNCCRIEYLSRLRIRLIEGETKEQEIKSETLPMHS